MSPTTITLIFLAFAVVMFVGLIEVTYEEVL